MLNNLTIVDNLQINENSMRWMMFSMIWPRFMVKINSVLGALIHFPLSQLPRSHNSVFSRDFQSIGMRNMQKGTLCPSLPKNNRKQWTNNNRLHTALNSTKEEKKKKNTTLMQNEHNDVCTTGSYHWLKCTNFVGKIEQLTECGVDVRCSVWLAVCHTHTHTQTRTRDINVCVFFFSLNRKFTIYNQRMLSMWLARWCEYYGSQIHAQHNLHSSQHRPP